MGLVPAHIARLAPRGGDALPEGLHRLVRTHDGRHGAAAGQGSLGEGPGVLGGGLDRHQVGADVAGGDQLAPGEASPHLATEPARLQAGRARPVVGEDVHDGIALDEGEEGLEIGRREGAHPVAGREHGASLRCHGRRRRRAGRTRRRGEVQATPPRRRSPGRRGPPWSAPDPAAPPSDRPGRHLRSSPSPTTASVRRC